MSHRNRWMLRLMLVIALLTSLALPAINASTGSASAGQSIASEIEEEGFVYYEDNGEIICRPATAEEARAMNERNPDEQLHVINRGGFSIQETGMMTIMLRGTQQLDTFPDAKNAFIRAANRWISLLQAPITIVVDVDFGPTRFGTPFPSGVLGSTGSQTYNLQQAQDNYAQVRAALIAKANTAQETSLDNSLPSSNISTDLGATGVVVGPSAVFRALGILNSVADPIGEQAQLGSPPSIGFNSNFTFDFNPDDGIDSDKIDFDAVATHEIGHVLGFSSRVGARELFPTSPLNIGVMDLFRFRPGVTTGTFSTAQHILSPGGDQVFFDGGNELLLSTGKPDGTGGDGNQASHWKDNTLFGSTIGIMDPAIARGERNVITESDLRAYDMFGFIRRDGEFPIISSVTGRLSGDVLNLTGSASDAQSNVTQYQTTLLDGSNNIVRQDSPVAFTPGQTSFNFNFNVAGLANLPAAVMCRLVFTDSQGNQSSAAVADFSQADQGGPTIKSASFSGSRITIKGKGLSGSIELEANGVIVSTKDNSSNKKLKINGNTTSLNLKTGFNRLRVRNGGLWSDIELLTL